MIDGGAGRFSGSLRLVEQVLACAGFCQDVAVTQLGNTEHAGGDDHGSVLSD